MWIIWKIGAVILFKTNMAEKDVWCAQTFHSRLTPLITYKGKKE